MRGKELLMCVGLSLASCTTPVSCETGKENKGSSVETEQPLSNPPGYERGYKLPQQITSLKKAIASQIETALGCPREGYFGTVTARNNKKERIKSTDNQFLLADETQCLRGESGTKYCVLQVMHYQNGRLQEALGILGVCATPENEESLRAEKLTPEIELRGKEQ